MAKLKILEMKDTQYTLQDVTNNEIYQFSLTFYGLDKAPEVNDFITLHDELLNPKYKEYSSSYQFGPLNEVYGRKLSSTADIECISVFSGNKQTFLKRFFG